MVKRITLLLVSLLLFSELAWAQRASQEDDRLARKKFEEDQRADEYANSLRRRDWLKDRLILEIGMGSKFPVMGSNWFGFGGGVEYITRWHISAFATIGFIPSQTDPISDWEYELEGGMGWRFGFAYYLFPKQPIHLSFQASYGTVYYDHAASDLDALGNPTGIRPLLTAYGYEFDIGVTYLSDQWYFLQALVGVYTIGNGKMTDREDNPDKASSSLSPWSFGRKNPSWNCMDMDPEQPTNRYICRSAVTSLGGRDDKGNDKEAMPPVGVVFGIGIGFAFEEFFPDDTEIRRREREEARDKQGSFRSTTPNKQPSRKAASRAARGGINTDEEEE